MNATKTGSVAAYACIEGYVFNNLASDINITCTDTGLWDDVNQICQSECAYLLLNIYIQYKCVRVPHYCYVFS